jgi:hypothetical protein
VPAKCDPRARGPRQAVPVRRRARTLAGWGPGNGLATTGRVAAAAGHDSRSSRQQRQPTEAHSRTPRTARPHRRPTPHPHLPPSLPHPPLPALAQRRPSGHSIPASKPLICIPDLCSDSRCRRPASGPKLTAWAHHQVYLSVEEGVRRGAADPFLESPGAERNPGRRRGSGLLPSKDQRAEINNQRSTTLRAERPTIGRGLWSASELSTRAPSDAGLPSTWEASPSMGSRSARHRASPIT